MSGTVTLLSIASVSSPQSQPEAKSAAAEASRYRIGALLLFRDATGRLLLMQRRRQPNAGLWCAVGGKLEMVTGESPYECAIREALEEVGMKLEASDLSLRCMLAEKNYKGTGHWLMFVFEVLPPIDSAPDCIEEGCFRLFERTEIVDAPMPELDRQLLCERILDEPRRGLQILRVDAGEEANPSQVVLEEWIGASV